MVQTKDSNAMSSRTAQARHSLEDACIDACRFFLAQHCIAYEKGKPAAHASSICKTRAR